jgi:hypothetical protein
MSSYELVIPTPIVERRSLIEPELFVEPAPECRYYATGGTYAPAEAYTPWIELTSEFAPETLSEVRKIEGCTSVRPLQSLYTEPWSQLVGYCDKT